MYKAGNFVFFSLVSSLSSWCAHVTCFTPFSTEITQPSLPRSGCLVPTGRFQTPGFKRLLILYSAIYRYNIIHHCITTR